VNPGATPTVIAHRDESLLAKAVAARLVTRLVDVQAARGGASVVLTGGGIGTRVLAQMAAAPARDAVDWRRLDIWWGDERYVPDGDPERNETAARAALLDHVSVDRSRIHAMPASDGPDTGPEGAAERYARELRAAARPEDHGPVPSFDVLMLGIGPDAHVASLFPGMPALYEEDRSVVAVRGAPKPPPTRLSLTFPAIRAAREVWIIASGEGKAAAVRMALSDEAGTFQVPAAGARGRQSTLFLIDRAAAAQLPPGMTEGRRI
jgi:6-phosphogluconolactonase